MTCSTMPRLMAAALKLGPVIVQVRRRSGWCKLQAPASHFTGFDLVIDGGTYCLVERAMLMINENFVVHDHLGRTRFQRVDTDSRRA